MGKHKIKFHVTQWGRCPTEIALEKFDDVSPELRDKMEAAIELLSEESHAGNLVEKVDHKLWCLRVRGKGGWARIFFTKLKNGLYVLLNGFVKKSNRIPRYELKKAINLMKEAQYVG